MNKTSNITHNLWEHLPKYNGFASDVFSLLMDLKIFLFMKFAACKCRQSVYIQFFKSMFWAQLYRKVEPQLFMRARLTECGIKISTKWVMLVRCNKKGLWKGLWLRCLKNTWFRSKRHKAKCICKHEYKADSEWYN